jgi:tetratricopeptide (TPR) repeat protein
LLKWRVVLKQAEEALKAGRLEEAYQLATRTQVREYRGARRLAARVAEALARRAEARLRAGQSAGAWQDLEQADRLGAAPRKLGTLRDALTQRQIDEATAYLEAGQPEAALSALARLDRRGALPAEGRRLRQAAATWQAGREQLKCGEFARALESLEEADRLLPDCEPLRQARRRAGEASQEAPALVHRLTAALADGQWVELIQAAEALLALAPRHPIALRVTRQAWEKLGALPAGNGAINERTMHMLTSLHARTRHPVAESRAASANPNGIPVHAPDESGRFLLWVDAVGGYLVCPGNEVMIGQPGGSADVPILGDVSARHATLRRDAEGWLVEARRPTSVNGRPVKRRALLRDGDELLLGDSVRLRFRQPTAVSTTARLEFVSRHRLPWAVEAVLLLSDTCVLGPGPQSHVTCPHWDTTVVLYRQSEELWCRTDGALEIDGRAVGQRGALPEKAKVRGETFSFSLEPVVSS